MSRPHRFGRLAVAVAALLCTTALGLAQSPSGLQTGVLASGDQTLESGEYYDEYDIEAQDGEEIILVLMSLDFDPYLILIPPTGEQLDNDDFGKSSDVSLIEVPVDEPGTWKIRVTSYSAGEVGEYALMAGTREADGEDADDSDEPEEFTIKSEITVGSTVEGTLNEDDPVRFDDSYYEAYALDVGAGTGVVITLESSDFDPYLVLVAPSGDIESNDDAEEGNLNSRIETTLEESGRWIVVANTLMPEDTGNYRLTVTER